MNQADSGYRWSLPTGIRPSNQLKILNSFTKKKEIFSPISPKTVKWYSCGPTVYDVSHLGHARCYITFDIIRRILTDYFGFQVFYVMNITDIDDKIIKKARSNYLCDKFIEEASSSSDPDRLLSKQLEGALDNYQARRSNEDDPAKLTMINDVVTSSKRALSELKLALEEEKNGEYLRPILEQLRDVIADEQDFRLASTVTDHKIFKALAVKFEQEFHEDMLKLNVLPPNCLTRVSEYMEETGSFLKRLEENGYAYRAGGSVYFDTEKFDSDPKHSYAKLVREAFGQKKSLEEGEGELSVAQQDCCAKRSPNDFALWKKSKAGEPSWTSQDYEPGRPGWHIECSVMASHCLGENFDIHSGGCDLKFPHHDNEIAQAEAYYDTGKDWVNYFVHSGHLSISGCKMSKSLKNFITIRQALQTYTSRQLRFAFLAHTWSETLDYSPDTMNIAVTNDKFFREFLFNVVDTLRRYSSNAKVSSDNYNSSNSCNPFSKWSNGDHELNHKFLDAINRVDSALCDNFNTRLVLLTLSNLASDCNKRPDTNIILLHDISRFVIRILRVFGVHFQEIDLPNIFDQHDSETNISGTAGQPQHDEKISLKFVQALADFRADIRKISKGRNPQDSVREILTLCDKIRDHILPDLGVKLEDKEIDGSPYVLKIMDPETIARERILAEKREQERRIKEEASKLEKLKLQKQREEKAKVAPDQMFRDQIDKYSKFDEKGMPTHDSNGKEISKSALKKLQRLYAEQEARYQKFIKEQ